LPVFAEDTAHFAVQLENTDQEKKYSISISHDGNLFETIDVDNTKPHFIYFNVVAKKRGLLNPKQFRLHTEFPMGLFVSWTIIDLSMQCLVYPAPLKIKNISTNYSTEEGGQSFINSGAEEYTGLKKYQPGESWRRISWKAMARNNELYTKEFSGGQPQRLWIDWHDIQTSNIENKLSIMAQMIIDADSKGRHYGLRLPDSEIAPDTGHNHYRICLKELALYGL